MRSFYYHSSKGKDGTMAFFIFLGAFDSVELTRESLFLSSEDLE